MRKGDLTDVIDIFVAFDWRHLTGICSRYFSALCRQLAQTTQLLSQLRVDGLFAHRGGGYIKYIPICKTSLPLQLIAVSLLFSRCLATYISIQLLNLANVSTDNVFNKLFDSKGRIDLCPPIADTIGSLVAACPCTSGGSDTSCNKLSRRSMPHTAVHCVLPASSLCVCTVQVESNVGHMSEPSVVGPHVTDIRRCGALCDRNRIATINFLQRCLKSDHC